MSDDHYAELRAAVERLPKLPDAKPSQYDFFVMVRRFENNRALLISYANVIIAARRLVEANKDTDQ